MTLVQMLKHICPVLGPRQAGDGSCGDMRTIATPFARREAPKE